MGLEIATVAFPAIAGWSTGAKVALSVALAASTAAATSAVQRALSPARASTLTREGQRLSQFQITQSTEGSPIYNSYGSMRLGGQLIWSTNLREVRRRDIDRFEGGKNTPDQKVEAISYQYFASFAVAICESEGDLTLNRLWLDGIEFDPETHTRLRFYDGAPDQLPDPKIQAIEGVSRTPAYRGIAYLVFDDRFLGTFGNRIPQVTVEVTRQSSFSLSATIRNICFDMGLTADQIDTSEIESLDDEIAGFYNDNLVAPASLIETLFDTYRIDAFEEGGKLVFVRRVDAEMFEIDEGDFISTSDGDSYVKTRENSSDLPDRVKVEFIDDERDYQVAAVDSHAVAGNLSRLIESFSTSAVMTTSRARALADTILHERHVSAETVRFTLPFSSESSGLEYLMTVRPGKIFRFQNRTYRVRRLNYGDDIEVEAVGYDASVYGVTDYAAADAFADTLIEPEPTNAEFMDVPLADRQAVEQWSPRIAVQADPWPGSVEVYRKDDSGNFNLERQVDLDSGMGVTMNDLPAGTPWQWDSTSELTVNMTDLTVLVSATEQAVLGGENTLLLKTPSGEWEVLQFVNATLNGDGTYTLSKLLRGQLGTEPFMGDPTPSGSRVVVYEPDRFSVLRGTTALLGVELSLTHVPLGAAPDDEDLATNVTVTPRGVAYRPYAPVHLKQATDGSDITLSWVRRTRFDGDSWATSVVPLNEDFEQYEIDIYDGASVVRTMTVDAATSVTYDAADQIADFGSTQNRVTWAVHQMSSIFGRGAPATDEA